MVLTAIVLHHPPHSRGKFVRVSERIHEKPFESSAQMSVFAEAVTIFLKGRAVLRGFVLVPAEYVRGVEFI